MSEDRGKPKENDGRLDITVRLPADLVVQLESFCREKAVPAERVVERALIEYFREGDMSH